MSARGGVTTEPTEEPASPAALARRRRGNRGGWKPYAAAPTNGCVAVRLGRFGNADNGEAVKKRRPSASTLSQKVGGLRGG